MTETQDHDPYAAIREAVGRAEEYRPGDDAPEPGADGACAPEPGADGDGAPPPGDADAAAGAGGGDGDGGPPRFNGYDRDKLAQCAAQPATDIGNGRRFRVWHGEDAVFLAGLGWAVYDGRRWELDYFDAAVRRAVHHAAEAIQHETAFIEGFDFELADIKAMEETEDELATLSAQQNKASQETERLKELRLVARAGLQAQAAIDDRRKARARFAKASCNSAKISNMLAEARPYLTAPIRDFDAEDMALNLENGTLRFHDAGGAGAPAWDVRLDAHAKGDRITKLAPVAWDEAAQAPEFERFLERCLPDDEVRGFVQRYLGYALTGRTGEQVFAFFYGAGRNGKSTLVDLVAKMLGDYATTLPFETLAGDTRGRGSDATPDLVRLPGARLVRAAEPDQGVMLKESLVKQLTGGEPIMIRRFREEFVEIYPEFKLILSGNHKPAIRGADEGIWRRVLLVPWTEQIPKAEVDTRLPEKLWGERAGILNWLVAGALDWLQGGLRVPGAVRAATDDYREESDPLGGFVREALEITGAESDRMTPGELYAAFEGWCKAAGISEWKATTFSKRISARAGQFGFAKVKSMGLSVYTGVRARPGGPADAAAGGYGAPGGGQPENDEDRDIPF